MRARFDDCMMLELVFEVIFMLVVGIMGMVGNVVLIATFARLQKRRLRFHGLMMALSLFDLIYIISSIYLFTIPGLVGVHTAEGPYFFFVPVVIPVAQICLTGSVYCTMAIAVERYLTVCKPFFTASKNWSSKRYIVPILVFSLIYNFPKFFEIRSNVECECHNGTMTIIEQQCTNVKFDSLVEISYVHLPNHTDTTLESTTIKAPLPEYQCNGTYIYGVILTEMRTNKYYYIIYSVCMNIVFMVLLPFCLLTALASITLRRLTYYTQNAESGRRYNQDINSGNVRQALNQSTAIVCRPVIYVNQLNEQQILKANEIMLARVSLVLSFVFIICHSIRWIPNVYELIQRIQEDNEYVDWPYWVEIITHLSHFMTVLNSSVNFYVYYLTRCKKNIS